MKTVVAALVLAAALGGCAPVIVGGPPMELTSSVRDGARLGAVYMSSDWLRSEEDFADTFTDEITEELRLCMQGGTPVDVRVHVDDIDRAGRLETLLNGDGAHMLSGTVEFVEPGRDGRVLGRYPVSVATSAQGRLGGLLGDRQMMVSEEFGRAICEQAFGRNPRPAGWRNATRG